MEQTNLRNAKAAISRGLKQFGENREGGVAILVALALPILLGVSALAVEYGHALVVQTEHQRISDLASYAGALAYGQVQNEDTMRASAFSVGVLNGVPTDQMTVALVPSPRTANAKAVFVSISSPKPIYLAKALGAQDLMIGSAAMAEVGGGTDGAGCIIALDPAGSGVTMSGGTTLNAPKCTVASNATITSPCGTKIVAKSAVYDAAGAPDQPAWCKTIQKQDGSPAPITKAPTADPLLEHKGILAAVDRFNDVGKIRAPVVAGGAGNNDLDFNPWDMGKRQKLTQALASQGCSAVYGSMWVVTCDPTRSSYRFGDFLIENGLTVEFNLNGPANAAYTFASIKSQSGGNYRFGPGTYNVPGGITQGGSEARFGAGSFNVGTGPCGFSICGGNNGTMTIPGPSSFQLMSGIVITGGLKAVIGSGSGNSYRLGPAASGQSIRVVSGSLVMAGAEGSATLFESKGLIQTGGGTCLAFPASKQHDIAGSVDVQGALEMGAGIYSIDGFLGLGQNGGGSADCNGRTTSLYAKDVTIFVSGKELMTGWACQGTAFCASSGYNRMLLTSPLSGDLAQIAIVGPLSGKAGATLTSGAGAGTISGAFYFPKGPIKMDGGSSASGTAESCLMMIGATITVSGGNATASECEKIKGGTGGAGKVAKLVM